MKVAYHFTCDGIAMRYNHFFYKKLLDSYFRSSFHFISTKILSGDLLVHSYIKKREDFGILLDLLTNPKPNIWKRLIDGKAGLLVTENIFVICLETIQKDTADMIHGWFKDEPQYVGAFEIDHTSEIHWHLYGECVSPKYRLVNKDFYIMTDNEDPEMLEYFEDEKEFFKDFPFEKLTMENANYRYSIFDDKHNYQNAKRAAQWKSSIDSLFSTVSDEIIGKLSDTAPELTDRLWSITNALDSAETGEQYAQAMSSCRRIFEYITDCLFPATDEIIDGHSLKRDKYKNRLLEFASREFKSKTNIELIVTNTSALFAEWEKLYSLSNKGVHDESHRQECRRCILRTILLLDDLISIKRTPFQVNIKSDKFLDDLKEKYGN